MTFITISTDYSGLVLSVCLADFGNTIRCVDTNTKKENHE